jgi:hypothetical protein
MKMFDESYVVYTFIRMIILFKIINRILDFCLLHRHPYSSFYRNKNILQRIFSWNSYTFYFLSILNSNQLFLDILLLDTIVYNCLQTMETFIQYYHFFQSFSLFPFSSTSSSSTTTTTTSYSSTTILTCFIILIFILGGLSNYIVESFLISTRNRPVREVVGVIIKDGMNSSVAACLGYTLQIAPKTIILKIWNLNQNILLVQWNAGQVLFYGLLFFLCHFLWIKEDEEEGGGREQEYTSRWFSSSSSSTRIFTWIVGALFGVIFYELQVQLYTLS